MAAKKPVKKVAPKAKKVVAKAKAVKTKPVATKAKAKVVANKPVTKLGKIAKPFTKSELYSTIAEHTELSRKQVAAVFDKLAEVIGMHLKGPEKFMLPGMLKCVVKKVAARPARKGISPFTGEEMTFKAKPASKKVKVIALRGLKDMI